MAFTTALPLMVRSLLAKTPKLPLDEAPPTAPASVLRRGDERRRRSLFLEGPGRDGHQAASLSTRETLWAISVNEGSKRISGSRGTGSGTSKLAAIRPGRGERTTTRVDR